MNLAIVKKRYIRCSQMNGNAAQLNAFVYEIVGLAAATAYKCRAHRMDSMKHAPDSVPTVYFCKLDPTVDNANYHLQKTQSQTTNKLLCEITENSGFNSNIIDAFNIPKIGNFN